MRYAPSKTRADIQSIALALEHSTRSLCHIIISIECIHSKILLARHLYQDISALSELRSRLGELGVQAESVAPLDPVWVAAFGELGKRGDPNRAIVFLYEEIKSRLCGEVERCRAVLHSLWDEPTVRILNRVYACIRAQIDEGSKILVERRSQIEVQKERSASGESAPCARLQMPDQPGRSQFFSIVPVVPRPPLDTPPMTLTAALLHHLLMSTEVPTIEHCAALIFDDGPRMPWRFTEDMARQCWDEARHAEACLTRLSELGHNLGDFPIELMLWKMTNGQPLPLRLAIHQRIGEWLGLDAALWWSDRLEREGDTITADMLRFVAQDEHLHVAFGNRWIRTLLSGDKAVEDVHRQAEAIRLKHGAGINIDAPFPIHVDICSEVGFSAREVDCLAKERSYGNG
jgi:uncharacterized ferritin-like protein (DUF455 family)